MPNSKVTKLPTKVEKPFWKQGFNRIPEVLSVSDIAEYLRVSEATVNSLIDKGDIRTLPGIEEKRVFKGFFLSYLTQSHPEAMGLMGKPEEKKEKSIHFKIANSVCNLRRKLKMSS